MQTEYKVRCAAVSSSCGPGPRARDHQGNICDTNRSLELVLEKPAWFAKQPNEQEVSRRSCGEIGVFGRPHMRASKIVSTHIERGIVVRVRDQESHPAFGRDSLRAHVPVKVIIAVRFDRNVFGGVQDGEVAATVEFKANRARAVRCGRGINVRCDSDERSPAPIEAAVQEILREASIPHQILAGRFVMGQTACGKCFTPCTTCVIGAILANQLLEKRKHTRQRERFPESYEALPYCDSRFRPVDGREEIKCLQIRLRVGGKYVVKELLNILARTPCA